MKQIFLRGGVLLGVSALGSKGLGLLRDRLLVQSFGPEQVDIVFAAFRIPDFFFFLLLGGVVSILFMPRVPNLPPEEKRAFLSSFLWLIVLGFGALSGVAALETDWLVQGFVTGFDSAAQAQVVMLARLLFGSVFLLAISSVFAAGLQAAHRFVAVALGPVLYMGGICAGIYFLRDDFGLLSVGIGAVGGAVVYLCVEIIAYFFSGGRVEWTWLSPAHAWRGMQGDFARRLLTNAAFQINQTIDIWIASFLVAGSVMAFSIGSTLGYFLLSVVGFSVANSAFPRLAQAQGNFQKQKQILLSSLRWIGLWTVPVAAVCAVFARPLVQLLFDLQGQALEQTTTVFFWVVLTLPAQCVIPIMSRMFFANHDTWTPLWVIGTALSIGTGVAVWLSLFVFSGSGAVLGLALGSATANVLVSGLYSVILWRKFSHA